MLLLSTLLVGSVLSLIAQVQGSRGTGSDPWWKSPDQNGLPICPGMLEERHYNIDVQVDNLPDGCSDQQLMVIGWLIEDAIQVS